MPTMCSVVDNERDLRVVDTCACTLIYSALSKTLISLRGNYFLNYARVLELRNVCSVIFIRSDGTFIIAFCTELNLNIKDRRSAIFTLFKSDNHVSFAGWGVICFIDIHVDTNERPLESQNRNS